MHLSFHYGFGIIFASLMTIFMPLTWWQYGLITFFSVLPDFDILYLLKSTQKNHRMFFTHSLYLSLIILIVGLIFGKIWIICCGIVLFLHVFVDLFDWGTNFFFNGRIVGPRLLLTKDEYDRVPELMKKEVDHKWFFVKRYFYNRGCQLAEIIIGVLTLLLLFLLTPEYWYFIFGYILTMGYHLFEFLELRYRNKYKRSRFRLVNH
ncbi:MAG: hypothetical protein DRO88_03985 [Promethearchaeia archaeon]|nr:MAG: hypothetical protein DRO88_03985 [Candidatus Lokiarchaeia archaeon]